MSRETKPEVLKPQDRDAALYIMETEKPVDSTEYANLVQLVFNKTLDVISAVHGANSQTMSTTIKLINTEGAALAAHYVYPALVYALGKSVEASKEMGANAVDYIVATYPEIQD